MYKDRILPGPMSLNLLPKGIKDAELGKKLLERKKAMDLASGSSNFLVAMIAPLLEAARDAYGEMRRHTRDIPAENAMRTWMIAIGYALIDDIIPVLRKNGKFVIALDLLDAHKKANPFFDDKGRPMEYFREGFNGLYEKLCYDCVLKNERAMIDDLRYPHKGEAKSAKYERLLGALADGYKGYGFVNFFRAFAAHVSRKPGDLDLLYAQNNEPLSAFIVARTINALKIKGGEDELIAKIERENRSLVELASAA